MQQQLVPLTSAVAGVACCGSYSARHPSAPVNVVDACNGGAVGGFWQMNPWGQVRLPRGAAISTAATETIAAATNTPANTLITRRDESRAPAALRVKRHRRRLAARARWERRRRRLECELVLEWGAGHVTCHQRAGPDLDLVPVLEGMCTPHAHAVDRGPVSRSGVLDEEHAAGSAGDSRVAPRQEPIAAQSAGFAVTAANQQLIAKDYLLTLHRAAENPQARGGGHDVGERGGGDRRPGVRLGHRRLVG